MAPVIGMTAFLNEDNGRVHKINTSFVEAILKNGGIPLIIPVTSDRSYIADMVERIDGLLIPGGQDVAPHLYGEEPCPQVTFARAQDDLFEMELIRQVRAAGKPILGICRGEQIINVTFGGTLYQDIPTMVKSSINHVQSLKIRSEAMHFAEVMPDSHLAKLLGVTKVHINTYHHQSVKDVAEGFKVVATAKDGIIEAIESQDGSIIGVQWHPELMLEGAEEFKRLFEGFIALCSKKLTKV